MAATAIVGAAMPNADIPVNEHIFPCTQCGKCCQNVHLSGETIFLDRGDGTCRHFDASTRQCTIYAQRPDVCRVDLQFRQRFVHLYSWDEYVAMNLRVCAALDAPAAPLA